MYIFVYRNVTTRILYSELFMLLFPNVHIIEFMNFSIEFEHPGLKCNKSRDIHVGYTSQPRMAGEFLAEMLQMNHQKNPMNPDSLALESCDKSLNT